MKLVETLKNNKILALISFVLLALIIALVYVNLTTPKASPLTASDVAELKEIHTTTGFRPVNLSTTNQDNNSLQFSFNRTEALGTIVPSDVACDLYIDSVIRASQAGVKNATEYNLTSNAAYSEGSHHWYVKCTNSTANSEQSDNLSFTFDQTNATITLTSPANRTNTTNQTLNVSFTYTDNINTSTVCELLVDGSVNITVPCSNNTATTIGLYPVNLSEGDHTWQLRVNDSGVNPALSEQRKITIDRTVPANMIQRLPVNFSNSTSPVNFTWEVYDGLAPDLACAFYRNAVLISTITTINNTNASSLQGLSDGHYNWTVVCADKAGNNATQGNFSLIVDNTTPSSITFQGDTPVDAFNSSSTTFTVNASFTETNFAACVLEMNNGTVANKTMTRSTGVNECTYTTEAQAVATITYKVWINDTAGNKAVGSTRTITMDSTAPTISSTSNKNLTLGANLTGFVNFTVTRNLTYPQWCQITIYGTQGERRQNITGTMNATGPNRFCEANFTGGDIEEGYFGVGLFGNTSLVEAAGTNQTNWTLTRLYNGWNLITAHKNLSMDAIANLSHAITRVSVFNNSNHSYITYVVGLNNSRWHNITEGSPVYVQTNANISLIRYWGATHVGNVNITLMNGWNQGFFFNRTGLTFKEICDEGSLGSLGVLGYDNSTIRAVSWYNGSSSSYISHRCSFALNNATLVPKGHSYWFEINYTTPFVRRGVA